MTLAAPLTSAIVAFAKNPELEPVKTRLAASLGQQSATFLFKALLADCLHSLKRLANTTGYLACSPNSRHPFFRQLAVDDQLTLIDQQGSTLGERMLNCIEALYEQHSMVAIVGTDSPILPIAEILDALALSNNWDVLLGPTFDGGYYLIAMKSPISEVFADIDWSTDLVLSQTRSNCQRLNLRLWELPAALDVDDLQSLRLLSARLCADSKLAKQTHAMLFQLGLI